MKKNTPAAIRKPPKPTSTTNAPIADKDLQQAIPKSTAAPKSGADDPWSRCATSWQPLEELNI